MTIFSIDPGSDKSAFVLYDTLTMSSPIKGKGILTNEEMITLLTNCGHSRVLGDAAPDVVVLEAVVGGYGMMVGKTTMATVFWSGRFYQAWGGPCEMITRQAVKAKVAGNAKLKDKHVRRALIENFGGDAKAIGKKKTPGPLFGVSSHEWAALAVAVAYSKHTNQ